MKNLDDPSNRKNDDKLDKNKSRNEFENDCEYIEYTKCVAKHLLGIVCNKCPNEYYEGIYEPPKKYKETDDFI